MSVDHGEVATRLVRDILNKLIQCKESYSHLLSEFDIQLNFEKLSNIVEQVILKEQKQTVDYVICGTTSCGKSLTINCLLQMNLMRSGIGHTTPFAVLIQTTNLESYIEYRGSDGKIFMDLTSAGGRKQFQNIVDNNSKGVLTSTDFIHVFVSQQSLTNGSMLSDRVKILDTPGMGREVFDSTEVKSKMFEADALILLVDIVTWADKEMLKLLKAENFFVKPNIIFAINKCDELYESEDDEERRATTKKNIVDDIVDMVKHSQITQDDIRKSIFFISSKTAWRIMNSGSHVELKPEESSMMEEFYTFKNAVISLAHENRERKKKERIDESVKHYTEKLKQELQRIKSEVGDVKQDIDAIQNEIAASRNVLEDVLNLNFVKDLYEEQLKLLVDEPGQYKVLVFLAHCRNERVRLLILEDVKKAVFKTLVVKKITAFVSRILSEEIKTIFQENTVPHYVQLYSNRLNPKEIEESVYKRNIKELEKEIEGLPSIYERQYRQYVAKCERKIENMASEHASNAKQRKAQIRGVQDDKSLIEQAGDATYEVAGECIKEVDKEGVGFGWKLLGGVAATGYAVLGTPSKLLGMATTHLFNKDEINRLKIDDQIRSNEEKVRLDDEKKRLNGKKKAKKELFRAEQGRKKASLQTDIMRNEESDRNYRQEKINECHSNYRQNFTDLYVHIIECALENVQLRLSDSVKNLDNMMAAYSNEISGLISMD